MYKGAEGSGGDSGAPIEMIGQEEGWWDTHRDDWAGGGMVGHP